jgi:hypothetical protein
MNMEEVDAILSAASSVDLDRLLLRLIRISLRINRDILAGRRDKEGRKWKTKRIQQMRSGRVDPSASTTRIRPTVRLPARTLSAVILVAEATVTQAAGRPAASPGAPARSL